MFRRNCRQPLNQNLFFKILQNPVYLFFASRCDVKLNDSFNRIRCSHPGNTVIGFKNKFNECDFAAIHTVVLFYRFQRRSIFPRVSGFSPAAGLKSGQSNLKRNFVLG